MKKEQTQSEKFIEKAREIGAEDTKAFEDALKKIAPPRKLKKP